MYVTFQSDKLKTENPTEFLKEHFYQKNFKIEILPEEFIKNLS